MNWVAVADIAAVTAAVLREPSRHGKRAYHLAAESASMPEIAELLGDVTGQPWRYAAAKPQAFYEQTVAAGMDPIYMACVRNYFERVGGGSLTDRPGIHGTIESVLGRPATSLRDFLAAHRDAFSGAAVNQAT